MAKKACKLFSRNDLWQKTQGRLKDTGLGRGDHPESSLGFGFPNGAQATIFTLVGSRESDKKKETGGSDSATFD